MDRRAAVEQVANRILTFGLRHRIWLVRLCALYWSWHVVALALTILGGYWPPWWRWPLAAVGLVLIWRWMHCEWHLDALKPPPSPYSVGPACTICGKVYDLDECAGFSCTPQGAPVRDEDIDWFGPCDHPVTAVWTADQVLTELESPRDRPPA